LYNRVVGLKHEVLRLLPSMDIANLYTRT